MARTRGASMRVQHVDDGELLDADDKPISALPAMGATFIPRPPTPAEPESEPAPARWRIDSTTVQRDMDGFEMMQLLGLLMGGDVSAEVDAEAFSALKADVKRHFRRVA